METPSQEISTATQYLEKITRVVIDYSPKLISAFLLLFVGLYTIRFINRLAKKIMIKRELDPTLSQFLANILLWALRILLFVTFISKLGIETSSFVAILGAAGLAIGMSLQGSLSNFAGGMLIILFKPFRVGDTIEAQNQIGTVDEIQIFVTKLISANNQVIFIPNGILSNGTIINYTLINNSKVSPTKKGKLQQQNKLEVSHERRSKSKKTGATDCKNATGSIRKNTRVSEIVGHTHKGMSESRRERLSKGRTLYGNKPCK